MAEDQPKQDTDAAALEALSAGRPDRSGDTHSPLTEQQAQEYLVKSAGPQEQPDLPELERELAAEIPEAPVPPGSRSTQEQAGLAQRRDHAQQFIQIMIPPMLVVGGLLLAFSAVTAFVLVWGGPSGLQSGWLMRAYGWPAVGAGVPLGALLLAAAWRLHGRLRRAEA